jgi:hypothetical protein
LSGVADLAVPADQAVVSHSDGSPLGANRIGDVDLGVDLEELPVLIEHFQAYLHTLICGSTADPSFKCHQRAGQDRHAHCRRAVRVQDAQGH